MEDGENDIFENGDLKAGADNESDEERDKVEDPEGVSKKSFKHKRYESKKFYTSSESFRHLDRKKS